MGRYAVVVVVDGISPHDGLHTLPFVVTAGAPSAEHFVLFGRPPAGTMVAGEVFELRFTANDASGNALPGLANGQLAFEFVDDDENDADSAELVELPVGGDVGPGAYLLRASPRIASDYQVSVLVGGRTVVPACQVAVSVRAGAPDPSRGRILRNWPAGQELEAGAPWSVAILVCDKFDNPVSMPDSALVLEAADSVSATPLDVAHTLQAKRVGGQPAYVVNATFVAAGGYTLNIRLGAGGPIVAGATFVVNVVPQTEPEWGNSELLSSPAYPEGIPLGHPVPVPEMEVPVFLGEEHSYVFQLYDAYYNVLEDYSCSETVLSRVVDMSLGSATRVVAVVEDGVLTVVVRFDVAGPTFIRLTACKTDTPLVDEAYSVGIDWAKMVGEIRTMITEGDVPAKMKGVVKAYQIMDDYPDESQVAELYRLITEAYDFLAIWTYGAGIMGDRLKDRGEPEVLVQCVKSLVARAAEMKKSTLQLVSYVIENYLAAPVALQQLTEAEARKLASKLKRYTIRVHPDKARSLGIDDPTIMSEVFNRVNLTKDTIKMTIDAGKFRK
ncbi:uncharacterized protein AMSG_00238 [Thecamonas trahens ATCC 50062]|uniref:Uncharacterized protein n=1 Tax=Thecamonas trahens ATCC 50062 TaxID=461836 RepID=A0A0L0D1X8_THETB|nr:hypothetical protein AMSG_00238 [Thecamonas trahens ATCC 50062]KNC46120.1 hypothetical protein AMSG_00238 [Thecamonas trahens ATCC 50062]|eukprot:XP_013763097.1 hypothetical protein AMSG_00238 [Thecamonas trahens ATCC 50062]